MFITTKKGISMEMLIILFISYPDFYGSYLSLVLSFLVALYAIYINYMGKKVYGSNYNSFKADDKSSIPDYFFQFRYELPVFISGVLFLQYFIGVKPNSYILLALCSAIIASTIFLVWGLVKKKANKNLMTYYYFYAPLAFSILALLEVIFLDRDARI